MIPTFKTFLLPIYVLLMFGCSSNKESSNDLAARDSILTSVAKAEKTDVIGYFDGDRVMDTVLIRILNDSNTNPDLPWSYAIEFSDPKFPPLEISPMMADGYVIINEGNLDPTAGEELSVITCGENNIGFLTTYAFDGKYWQQITESADVQCIPDGIDPDELLIDTDSGIYVREVEVAGFDSLIHKRRPIILVSTTGDFDGDNSSERVYIKTLHDAGLDDSGFWEYAIEFSDPKIPSIIVESREAAGCDVANTGNTNGKPGDEISITTYGQMQRFFTHKYTYRDGKWEAR